MIVEKFVVNVLCVFRARCFEKNCVLLFGDPKTEEGNLELTGDRKSFDKKKTLVVCRLHKGKWEEKKKKH